METTIDLGRQFLDGNHHQSWEAVIDGNHYQFWEATIYRRTSISGTKKSTDNLPA
jgi:hypothetical protein